MFGRTRQENRPSSFFLCAVCGKLIQGKANTIHLAIQSHLKSEIRKGLRMNRYPHGIWVGPQDNYGSHISKERAEFYFKLFEFHYDCEHKKCCAPSHFVSPPLPEKLKSEGYCWECRHRNWTAFHIFEKRMSPSEIKAIDGNRFPMQPSLSKIIKILNDTQVPRH